MPEVERYEILVIGSGEAGKHADMEPGAGGPPHGGGGTEVHRRVVSEHRVLAEQERDSQRKGELVRAARHGIRHSNWAVSTDMRGVLNRKRKMVEGQVQFHLDRFKATGAELIRAKHGSWLRRRSRCG